jgi:hypothetical protein
VGIVGAQVTILFSTGRRFSVATSWLSWLIKRFTRSRVSHTAIGTDMHGVPVILHATQGGVQVTLRSRFERGNVVLEEYRIKPAVQDALEDQSLRHAVEHVGERYDYAALVGYAALILAWRWFRKKIKNPLASPRALVCSEFCLHLNHAQAIPEWNGLDPERTTAEDLRIQCARGVSFERLV